MSTLSLLETGISTGNVKLGDLFDNVKLNGQHSGNLTLNQLIDLTIVGGWPSLINKTVSEARSANVDYLRNVIENDASRLCKGSISKNKLDLVLKSLSRNISTTVKYSTIVQDVFRFYNENIANETVADYIQILKNLYIVDEIPA
ncbi:hypothetical protein FACS1894166_09210 [Bacilli bacterium]|nr:hypothetical protein FACS1894166_09210 [Bacilli bacterium]